MNHSIHCCHKRCSCYTNGLPNEAQTQPLDPLKNWDNELYQDIATFFHSCNWEMADTYCLNDLITQYSTNSKYELCRTFNKRGERLLEIIIGNPGYLTRIDSSLLIDIVNHSDPFRKGVHQKNIWEFMIHEKAYSNETTQQIKSVIASLISCHKARASDLLTSDLLDELISDRAIQSEIMSQICNIFLEQRKTDELFNVTSILIKKWQKILCQARQESSSISSKWHTQLDRFTKAISFCLKRIQDEALNSNNNSLLDKLLILCYEQKLSHTLLANELNQLFKSYSKSSLSHIKICLLYFTHIGQLSKVKDLMRQLEQSDPSLDLDSIKDENGNGLIHLCAYGGFEETMTTLISKNIRLNTPNKNGDTALHIAAKKGYTGTIRQILSKMPLAEQENNLIITNQNGLSPIDNMVIQGRTKILSDCLEILRPIKEHRSTKMLKHYVEHNTTTLIHAAKYTEMKDGLLQLVAFGFNPIQAKCELTKETLLLAIYHSREKSRLESVLPTLLDLLSDNDPSAVSEWINECDMTGKSLIHMMIEDHYIHSLRSIFKGREALLTACFHYPDSNKNLPLHLAAANTSHIIFTTVLELSLHKILDTKKSYLLDYKNQEKKTPLDIACEAGHDTVVSDLLNAGANPSDLKQETLHQLILDEKENTLLLLSEKLIHHFNVSMVVSKSEDERLQSLPKHWQKTLSNNQNLKVQFRLSHITVKEKLVILDKHIIQKLSEEKVSAALKTPTSTKGDCLIM